jgi:hypothetical protein
MATNPWTAEIARINSVIQQTLRNIARDQSYLAAGFFPAGTDAATLREQIASGENYLIDLRAQLAIFTTEYNNFGKNATASSGQVVAEEAQARAEGAVASNPSTPSSVLAPNGRINANNVERGTDDPVRPQDSNTKLLHRQLNKPDLIG